MKRTLVQPNLSEFPTPFRHLLENCAVYDSSCSPEARVWFIDREGGYYLKAAEKGSLAREAEMDRYFHQKGLTAAVLDYRSEERDWLLTARVAGEDCTYAAYLAEPERLCDLLAQRLRALHELNFADCPVQDRMTEYLATVERNHAAGVFDPSFLPENFQKMTAAEAYARVMEQKHLLRCDCLLHGDYCSPNIMLDDWKFSGFIDLGNGGVGDRHVDLFWGVWTLAFNLKTPRYGSRFLDAYGRDKVNNDLLAVIAAAECFG
ncbi:MAG: aminoglycoside 3'-phosphotransferase [Clostridia bacterium]|nr:aminoglycoside 3'-phosphotransferase [Clostridia bacterium]